MSLVCVDCERPTFRPNDDDTQGVPYARKGCCWPCYSKRKKAGTLSELPARNTGKVPQRCRNDRGRVEYRAEDYLFLRKQGENFDQIAARMGIKPKSLRQALWRAGVSAREGLR